MHRRLTGFGEPKAFSLCPSKTSGITSCPNERRTLHEFDSAIVDRLWNMSTQSMEAALASHPSGVVVHVWAVPGASRNHIVGLHGTAVRIRVGAPPEDGKANKAIGALLRSVTGARVDLLSGATKRRKRFLVRGGDHITVASQLERAAKR